MVRFKREKSTAYQRFLEAGKWQVKGGEKAGGYVAENVGFEESFSHPSSTANNATRNMNGGTRKRKCESRIRTSPHRRRMIRSSSDVSNTCFALPCVYQKGV